jgi:hypothetical protein
MVVWAEKDSNLRSRKTADLQSAPVGRLGICPPWYCFFIKKPDITPDSSKRAACRNRTSDLLITSQLLYQLS